MKNIYPSREKRIFTAPYMLLIGALSSHPLYAMHDDLDDIQPPMSSQRFELGSLVKLSGQLIDPEERVLKL